RRQYFLLREHLKTIQVRQEDRKSRLGRRDVSGEDPSPVLAPASNTKLKPRLELRRLQPPPWSSSKARELPHPSLYAWPRVKVAVELATPSSYWVRAVDSLARLRTLTMFLIGHSRPVRDLLAQRRALPHFHALRFPGRRPGSLFKRLMSCGVPQDRGCSESQVDVLHAAQTKGNCAVTIKDGNDRFPLLQR